MPRKQKSTALYPHPFSKAYWRDAAAELKDTKMLVFAALMIALRLILKLVYIPLAPGLQINTAFIANALGAMVFGPVVAAICAVITDILGFVMNPTGVYFVPFVLTEVAGSVIFALFFYRVKVTPVRVMLSRFCICFFVNVVLQTPIMIWYYKLFLPNSTYLLTIPGIIKNLFMFPIESVVLTLFLGVMIPITSRVGLTHAGANVKESLRFSKPQSALLAALFVVGIASATGYLFYYYDTTSISASYTSEQRLEANCDMNDIVGQQTNDWDGDTTVSVIESAYRKFTKGYTTYNVAVYTVDEEALAQTENTLQTLQGYSKSKAAADETMTRVASAVIVVEDKDGALLSFDITPEAAG